MFKVLFIAHCRCMYGANKSLLNLMLDLRCRYQVSPYVVLPIEEDGEFAQVLDSYQIPYFVCPYKRWVEGEEVSLKGLRVLKKTAQNAVAYRKLYKQLRGIKFDLVHSNSSTIQIGAWLAKHMNLPHVWHLREFGQEDYHIQIIYPKWVVNRLFSAKNTTVIAISEAIAQKYASSLCKGADLRIIYNGINDNTPKRVYTQEKEENVCRFVCTGVLNEQKGQIDILKACAILKNEGNTQMHLYLLGTGTPEYEQVLKTYVKEQELEEYVSFMGYRADAAEFMKTCDVGIVASQKEAFGRVTVEYMFASLAVIGTNSGGTPEIIMDGEHGYLYEVQNERELADRMKKLMTDPAKRRKMGQQAYDRAQQMFSMKANTDQIFKVYSARMNGYE